MHKVISRKKINKDVFSLEVEAAEVALNAKPGQFVMVVNDKKGERIPLTIADKDTHKGTIKLIFQVVGYSTKKLSGLRKNDNIEHILGPLGKPTEIKVYGEVICVGGGVGLAELYPVAKAFKDAGNYVISILGARTKKLLILQDELKKASNKIRISTNDGSKGKKGLVTDVLEGLLKRDNLPKLIYAIGPVPMMRAVSELTREFNIKTLVSLNPILVDATGMCGSCRCKVDGKTVFACVDGPEFDAQRVDFDSLEKRLKFFKKEEAAALRKLDIKVKSKR